MNKVVLLIYRIKHSLSVVIDFWTILDEIKKFCMELVSVNVENEKKLKVYFKH